MNTVKPIHSEHCLDLEKVSATERYPLQRGLSQIGLSYLEKPP